MIFQYLLEASGLNALGTGHQLLLQTLRLNIDLNFASFNIPLTTCWVWEAQNPLFFPPKNIFPCHQLLNPSCSEALLVAAHEQSPRGLGGLPECGLRTAVTMSMKCKRASASCPLAWMCPQLPLVGDGQGWKRSIYYTL